MAVQATTALRLTGCSRRLPPVLGLIHWLEWLTQAGNTLLTRSLCTVRGSSSGTAHARVTGQVREGEGFPALQGATLPLALLTNLQGLQRVNNRIFLQQLLKGTNTDGMDSSLRTVISSCFTQWFSNVPWGTRCHAEGWAHRPGWRKGPHASTTRPLSAATLVLS